MTERVGIERMGLYPGRAFVDVAGLAAARGLDRARFDNLLLRRKSVALPFEDPVSFAVNAAKPMIDRLDPAARDAIRLLIVASESGIDFGKSMGAYVQHHLGLARGCRQFEIKQACYGGTAALQMAAASVLADSDPTTKALVIATDLARPVPYSYAEPSQGAAAVALLIGRAPAILALERGASGVHAYEVMDACRPTSDIETGNAELSVVSYLDCLDHAFAAYRVKTGGIDLRSHFAALAFHTPFGGLVKGAHRQLMRKVCGAPPAAIDADFDQRVRPGLRYCQEIGNAYSATVFVALAGAIDNGRLDEPARIGLFSYGSGCCSEFYSGIVGRDARAALAEAEIPDRLAERVELTMPDYDRLLAAAVDRFGVRDATVDAGGFGELYDEGFVGQGLLVLDAIVDHQRRYRWS